MSLKGHTHTADFLSWEENQRVINRLYEDREWQYCMIFVIGSAFGLRIGDIKRIKWDDLFGRRLIFDEEKRYKKRNIPIDDKMRDFFLDVYNKMEPKSRYVVTVKHTQAINRKLKRLKERYGIRINNFSTHTFRKTFGRHYVEVNGFSARAIAYLSQAFNHGSVEQTMIYIGITRQEIDNVYYTVSSDVFVK